MDDYGYEDEPIDDSEEQNREREDRSKLRQDFIEKYP